ncbi:unnamed protein product [Musa banksii]
MYIYPNEPSIESLQLILRSPREGRDFGKVESNLFKRSAILYFLEKDAQSTETVYDILSKAEFFNHNCILSA